MRCQWNSLCGCVSFCFVLVQVVRTLADRYSTGETPWVKSIIEKYHETAKANGAIVRSGTNFCFYQFSC
jgi:hypothetical protein